MSRYWFASAILFCLPVLAQEAPPLFVRDAVGVKSYASAPRLAERLAIEPAVILGAAREVVPEEIDAITRWNAEGREPARIGFTRRIPDGVAVRVGGLSADRNVCATQACVGQTFLSGRGVSASSANGTSWSGAIQVKGAHRLRLHLTNVKLPANATLWVSGAGEPATGFGSELANANGDLYTPSVSGETAYIEVEVPSGESASFDIIDVLELIAPHAPAALDLPTCLIDSSCVSTSTLAQIASFRHAIAHLEYVKNGSGFVCSGTLLNDADESTTVPYLLTANHCLSDQTAASTLEAFFDYYTAACNATFPAISSKPKSNGSTLLATNAAPGSDFTFVRLNSMPSGRTLLGWNANTAVAAAGTTIYRLSHPFPDQYTQPAPQFFSTTTIVNPSTTCSGLPVSSFLYSNSGSGGIYGGSSGGAAFTSSGQVVGQLLGTCGPTPEDGCNAANRAVDGAFSATFPFIQQYVNTTSTAACTPSATQLCLNNDRFAVKVDWKRSGGETGQGQGIKYTANSGLFWFFADDNIELIVKILTGCPLSNTYWVFAAATTNVEYTLTVTDTKNGKVKTYLNPQGVSSAAITDTNAFATCP